LVDPLVADEVARKRQPLRICHLAYSFYENDNRVRRYAEALAEEGNDVEVLALRRKGQTKTGCTGAVRVLRIQRRAVTERHASAYLLKILWFFVQSMVVLGFRHLRRPYDIVHVHNVPDFLVFAAFVPKLMGARLILDIHDIQPELYAGKFGSDCKSMIFRTLLWVEKLSCGFVDHVIVANDLWYDKLITRALEARNCTTILNYPDLRIFKPLPDDQKRRDGKFVMLYPGTLNHHQGLDIAIRAFALAKDRMPAAELHIYGEGPERPELLKVASECGLMDRVRMMDRLPLEEIAQVMASADVGVVPKRADGFGNEAFSTKTLEFMACCVPVVVSRTMVDEHYFEDTLVSFFVPGSDEDLANVMVRVYETRIGNAERIKAARKFVIRNSWQERIHEYLRLVDSLQSQTDRRAVTQ
jgi:glycosyltransferase involved in cell wall biosynthesis